MQDKMSDSSLDKLSNKDQLFKAFELLHLIGYLLYFLDDTSPDESLLILDEEVILGHLHASLGYIRKCMEDDMEYDNLEYNLEHKRGIIEEDKLKQILTQPQLMAMGFNCIFEVLHICSILYTGVI